MVVAKCACDILSAMQKSACDILSVWHFVLHSMFRPLHMYWDQGEAGKLYTGRNTARTFHSQYRSSLQHTKKMSLHRKMTQGICLLKRWHKCVMIRQIWLNLQQRDLEAFNSSDILDTYSSLAYNFHANERKTGTLTSSFNDNRMF